MTTSEIELILERYFEGETTLQEEKKLREFFHGPVVPDYLKSYQPLFGYFEQSGSEAMVPEAKVIQLHPKRNQIIFVSSLAAGVLLVIGLFFTFLNNYSGKNQLYSSNAEVQMAYLQTEEALMLVSGNLNNGLKQIKKLESFDMAMSNLQRISKFSQYQPLIINPDETKISPKN